MIRPLERDDLPAVADLFELVQRSGAPKASPGLVRYFERMFFDHPWVDPDIPSLVYESTGGPIQGFIGSHVRRAVFDGRPARMAFSGQLVVHPEARRRAPGAFLVRQYLSGPQDLWLTDGANLAARRIATGLGAVPAGLAAVEWYRIFRPWSIAGLRLAPSFRRLWRALDSATPGVPLAAGSADLEAGPLTASTFLEAYAAVIPSAYRFYVDYDAPFAAWLFDELGAAKGSGDLVAHLLRDERGNLAGWYVYYLKPNGMSSVIQVFGVPGQEARVLRHLVAHACDRGAAGLKGRLEPLVVGTLADERRLLLRNTAGALVYARDPDLLDAAVSRRGFLTRMEGERWSTDHLDPARETS